MVLHDERRRGYGKRAAEAHEGDFSFLALRRDYDHQCAGERRLLDRGPARTVRRRQFHAYAASRSVALLIAALICAVVRSRTAVAALALVMTLVQAFDGLIGALAHDPAKTYGPLAFALANVAVLVWLLRAYDVGNEARNSV
jgi:hypothetical protein